MSKLKIWRTGRCVYCGSDNIEKHTITKSIQIDKFQNGDWNKKFFRNTNDIIQLKYTCLNCHKFDVYENKIDDTRTKKNKY